MARWIASGLRAPLVRFLAVGLVIYLGLAWVAPHLNGERAFVPDRAAGSGNFAKRIVVEREELLAFVQMRTRQPNPQATAHAFDGLTPEQRQSWIDRFVREEALVREARMLGLDRDDELIRRRLVQKMEFLTVGVAEGVMTLAEGDLEAFYREHVEEYRVPTILTFAHVFIRGGGESIAPAEALALLEELNGAGVGFFEALSLGDRFLYNRHYVDRTLDEVRSHFGSAMAETLSSFDPDAGRWQGPLRSDHGWHGVLLLSREDSRLPSFGEIVSSLRRDLAREQSETALEAGLENIVSQYQVELAPELSAEQ